ncbi:invasin domain 3-containing protein, partial [Yersinia enterocolitica]|uniref:invasin domain 3-containing protein n=1 Tax=Yersinia enterocolitica TaxID=630 RepID=UPI00398D680C
TPVPVDSEKSSLAVSPASIVANGTATSTLSFTARDVNNNPLTGRTVTFATSGTGATGVKVGTVTGSNGIYTATLTAGTTAGAMNVAVAVNGTTVAGTNNSKTVTLTPAPADSAQSSLAVSPASIVANGTATSTLSFTARDVNNNPLTGRTVTFATSGTGATGVKVGTVTGSNGIYTATLTAGTTAGPVNVAVAVNGTTVAGTNNSKTVTLTPAPADSEKSSLAVSPASIVANGTATSTLSFTARDVNNNPLTGRTVTFATSGTGATGVKVGTVTGSNGIYTATLTAGTTAGPVNVAVAVNGTTVAGKTGSITLTPANFTGIAVNDHNFAIDAGFPSTGIVDAAFTLNMSGIASDYTWTSSAPSWVTVNSGTVSFIAKGNKTPVTITATPKVGGTPLTYTFSVRSWFFKDDVRLLLPWSDASNVCTEQGLALPTRAELTLGKEVRAVGAFWAEWGRTPSYALLWTSEVSGSSYTGPVHYVMLGNGLIDTRQDVYTSNVMCWQGL